MKITITDWLGTTQKITVMELESHSHVVIDSTGIEINPPYEPIEEFQTVGSTNLPASERASTRWFRKGVPPEGPDKLPVGDDDERPTK